MNFIKYFIIAIVLLLNLTGCTNPNELSVAKIEDTKNVTFKEDGYKEILVDKTLISDTEEQMKLWFLLRTNNCVKELDTYNYKYYNEKFYTNDWFEITDENLIVEYNLRNLIKEKDDLKNENLILGGTQGNKIIRIKLPYKIIRQENKDYRFILNNSDKIELIESVNLKSNKIYEETVYNKGLESFKFRIGYLSECIKKK